MLASPSLTCFSGSYPLHRRPHTPQLPLQAWDAADEYLLATAREYLTANDAVLLINDTFGALAVGLHEWEPESWGDSYTAHLATAENLARNHLPGTVRYVPSTATPVGSNGNRPAFKVVLWRIPKSVGLWQQQMALLAPLLTPETVLLVGGMVKHLPGQAREMLGALGVVETLPAVKKARLYRVLPGTGDSLPTLPINDLVVVPQYDLQLESLPNVFAQGKLDSGARVFLEQFDRLPSMGRLADLGCGNGVLGLAARRRFPLAEVYFFDESYQAVASAEANSRRNLPDASAMHFAVDDVLSEYRGDPFDVIVCNPPFHQGHVVGDQTAWEMFIQSRRHLRPGGELWIVGNRHLNYHIKLKRLFGNYRQVAAHPRFVVLSAVR